MKHKILPLALLFTLVSVAWAQDTQSPAPASKSGSMSKTQTPSADCQQMMEMHKEEMEAMKADVEKMKASLAQMKANLFTIRDTNEMARWRNNVDMWEAMVGHMDRMLQHMESMGPRHDAPRNGRPAAFPANRQETPVVIPISTCLPTASFETTR